jgi:hypothetical protein
VKKENKTAKELADMMAERLNIGGVFIAVHKDPTYGWHPQVITKPAAAIGAQLRAEEIAQKLRTEYDLAEE